MSGVTRWAELRHYVRFDEADEEALRLALPVVEPRFQQIADEFYDRILEHEGTRRVLTGGSEEVARLKCTLLDWLQGCFRGPWDEAYFHLRSRIGRAHVRIGLEPRYMILAMHVVRRGLQSALIEGRSDLKIDLFRAMRAVEKICDLELAIMIETYSDAFSNQLKRRERLAVIGQLGASISHEVKNPLGVIASSVYALKAHLDTKRDARLARHIEKIQRNVEQANKIVTTLLDFLRTKAAARVERDWNELVSEAAQSVALPGGVELELALAPDAGRAAVDPLQIASVVANLVRNAGEAMIDGGRVTVATRGTEGEVEVLVRDRGPGLPGNVLPQLFEPLFTTKEVGTGLGLALAKAIVEAHGGSIQARNAEGGGAEFCVCLPRWAPTPEPAEDRP